jgi:hypothetical protein
MTTELAVNKEISKTNEALYDECIFKVHLVLIV